MRKITAALISSLFLAIFTNIAFAEVATAPGTTRINKNQERLDTRKVNIAQRVEVMKEQVASRAANLKAKLNAFKDKKKAATAERVNVNLNRINQNQTDQMLKHLGQMSGILDKLETRVNSATPDIKNPAVAKTAIVASRTSIASATAAVKAQAAKDYTITVTSESTVKKDAEASRNKLRTDLLDVRKQVIAAKQSVSNAIRVAKSGQAEKEGSASGKE